MVPVLEAVPNFSEGRDLNLVRELVDAIAGEGADVLDWSADPDHNRSVVTFVGDPDTVRAASLAAARLAIDSIDLARHQGVHPRIGALDVLPFVPLCGLSLKEVAGFARQVAGDLVGLGVPVYLYGEASDPPRRSLSEIRRGGYEALRDAFPAGRAPDLLPQGWSYPGVHPRAGAVCVGARKLLLAWNVYVEDLDIDRAREVAGLLRESGGGFPGLRALGMELPRQGRVQVSMNLEDMERTSPLQVFRVLEEAVAERGGRVAGTEVVGMIPDALVLSAATDRLRLLDAGPARLLSRRLADHLARRCDTSHSAPEP